MKPILAGDAFVFYPDASSGNDLHIGFTDPNRLSFAFAPGQTVVVAPSFLTRSLDTGTNVTLQSSNDITVDSPIAVSPVGTPGSLTLQAGRSILLNAGITTAGGNLTLIANDSSVNGVVEADRAPGAANITGPTGTVLDTGAGRLTVDLRDAPARPAGSRGTVTIVAAHAGAASASATSVLGFTIAGTNPGDGIAAGTYTQIQVAGPFDLNGAGLQISDPTPTPAGTAFTIVHAAGGVTGTFAGLPDGATVSGPGGVSFVIHYGLNGGQDVVLTQVTGTPSPPTVPPTSPPTAPPTSPPTTVPPTVPPTSPPASPPAVPPTTAPTVPPTAPPTTLPPAVPPATSRQLLVGVPQYAAGGAGAVRFYNPDGSLRAQLTPFPGFTGEVRTAVADFNGDGVPDVVAGTGPGGPTHVAILDGKDEHVLFSLDPFEASFTGGVYVAAGDVTGDGVPDLVITPDEGGGPRVRVFTGAGFGLVIDFYGIDDPAFRGGARAAIGDVTGDGVGDLIVSAGFQGGPRVAGFDGRSLAAGTPRKIFGDFFAFEPTLRNGVFLTVGDVNGDGYADVVAGGGPGGGPRVTVFDGKALLTNQQSTVADFFAGDPANRGGVRLAVKDLDGDARADLVVGSGAGAGSHVTAYRGTALSGNSPPSVFDYDALPGFTGGVFVG